MPLRKQQPALDGGSEQTPPAADLEPKTGEEPILSQRLVFPDDDDVVGKLTKMMDAIEVEQKSPTPEPMPLQESLPAVAHLEVPDSLPLETIAQPVATDAVDPYDDNGKALLKAGGIPEPIISPPGSRNVSSTDLDPDSQNPDPNSEETPPGIVRSGSGANEDSLTKKINLYWFDFRNGFLLIHSFFRMGGI